MDGEETVLRGSKPLIATSAMLAGLMAFIDISIVNVGLSDIRASFGTPLDQIAWVSTSYAMANITVIPVSGWLLKRFGFRTFFTACIAMFTLASALCGLAWNLESLVLFRILQGLGGGAIIPTSQSALFARFPEHQQGHASALFAIGAITGPLLGPSLGGYLISISSWHWMFFINVPLGITAALLAWTQLEQPAFKPARQPVDYVGIGLLALGMVNLQYVLEEGGRSGWFESRAIIVCAVVAVISLVAFVSHELEEPNCVVDLRIFRNRGYAAASAYNMLVGTSLFGGGVLFALYMGAVMKYDAQTIGLVFLRGNWIQLLLFPLAGGLVARFDPRLLLLLANATFIVSLGMNAQLTSHADTQTLVLPLLIRGIGIGVGFVPLTLLAIQNLPVPERPAGTALFNMTRELGASAGTAWLTTSLGSARANYAQHLGSHVDAYAYAWYDQHSLFDGWLAWMREDEHGLFASVRARIDAQALTRAFNDGFLGLALAFVFATVLILLMKRPHVPLPSRR